MGSFYSFPFNHFPIHEHLPILGSFLFPHFLVFINWHFPCISINFMLLTQWFCWLGTFYLYPAHATSKHVATKLNTFKLYVLSLTLWCFYIFVDSRECDLIPRVIFFICKSISYCLHITFMWEALVNLFSYTVSEW